jgi:hypothetical protein
MLNGERLNFRQSIFDTFSGTQQKDILKMK